ncbi:MAG: cation:dicarboxylase symporter family transporter [Gemmatimonadetes bacterium]|nr:cation:dicarboxylase symporter family transporter [Gemmatimonadota bacterium]NIO31651.1 cation:dicarboxylase symporter family transporter [Gemmatimonadota bacterium]
MTEPSTEPRPSLYQRYRRLSLGVKILIFMVLGVIAGIAFGERATVVQPLGDLFIRLLMMAVIPLVFFNLLAGLTSLSDVRALGRLGGKILLYYFFTTTVALTAGLAVMHVLRPGVGMLLTEQVADSFGEAPGVLDVLLDLVPVNVFEAFATGNVAQVVVFAIFLGVVTLFLQQSSREPLQNAYGLLAELFRKLVGMIMYFGPIGLGALAAATVGEYGGAIFGPLAVFLGGVWGAQVFMVVVYLVLLYAFTRHSAIDFLKRSGPLYATTAATCSSLASLAVSLDVAEERMQLPRSVYTFTLPLGAQLNKDGTAIMLAGVLMFTAQAAGVEFSLATQVSILLIGLVLTTGSGGIPGGGLVVALIFVEAFNLPLEIAAIVGGIYRLIDMGSTTINCMGDLVGTVIVAHSERELAPSG